MDLAPLPPAAGVARGHGRDRAGAGRRPIRRRHQNPPDRVPDAAAARPLRQRPLPAVIGLTFVSLLALAYIGAFLDLSQKLFKGQANGWMFLSYLWYSTPKFIGFAIPSATLVAVLGTIGGLTRTGELTVMRACGISLYRTALPLLVIAIVWSGVLFMLDERARRREPARRDAERPDARPAAPYLRRRQPELARERRNGPRVLLRVDGRAAAALHGLSVFETARSPID